MKRLIVALFAVTLVAASLSTASAQVPRRGIMSPSDFVRGGVMEVGLSGLFLLNYATQGDDESLRVTVRGGLSFAYFLRRALSLRLELAGGYFHQNNSNATNRDTTTNETTFQVDVMANYYLHISRGMFWKPGLGLGFRTGSQSVTVPDTNGNDIRARASLLGGHVRLDLGLAFFSSPHFNLKAGPEFFFSFGGVDPDDGSAGSGFFRIDAGFSLGAYYVF